MQTSTNQIDPTLREQSKTRNERVEDIAYTVNHAISCGVTDIVVQPVAAAATVSMVHKDILPKWLHWLTHVFEHDHHDHPDAPHPEGKPHGHGPKAAATEAAAQEEGRWQSVGRAIVQELRWSKLWGHLKHWGIGETFGDVGGIAPTIYVQRHFPGFMHGLRQVLEPVAGWAYHNGAHRDAKRWGKRHGYAADAPEVKAKEESFYQHEMEHLPQAVVWNAFSIPINGAVQACTRLLEESTALNSKEKVGKFLVTFAIGKGFGTLFSNGILLGGRALAPKAFIGWDQWSSQHLLRPALRMAGMDKDTADRMARKQQLAHHMANDNLPAPANDVAPKGWQDRTRRDAAEAMQTHTAR